ncbi:DNA cytosine methyltransferase [Neisseria leonii]|uniref:DNA cytosine methyltransferase n=1 Tax=Neisseria leonii TaxID=2995413 RepID=UPI00237A1214|nr:DNA (cytosine-5-)-methyltransferase [Neisseria sp. 3986]MDD9326206.1 DNA (cytosine-5-)-methyltransferase [Neisseria sp. 3986]
MKNLVFDFDDLENNSRSLQANSAYKSIELFAGAGGLALGLELAGFDAVLLNEWDKYACATLRANRPNWNVLGGDVSEVDFTPYRGQVDFLSGGFPCQAFSYAGLGKGFDDIRGTMFFQFARAIDEVRPKVILGENVRGLVNHDKGRTLTKIKETLKELDYMLIEPKILNAMNFRVPQKRERIFIVGIRHDLVDKAKWHWPTPYHRPMLMSDALKAGELYDCDVPDSVGQSYPEHKKAVLDLVPQGGCWRDLPDDVARAYMKGSYFLGGGKTGMARRLSWNEPCLTLTCSPAQTQTERCHPDETRPLTVREYARIQTFPDHWEFCGSITQQYKQIGNAVPVNLAKAMGYELINLLNHLS